MERSYRIIRGLVFTLLISAALAVAGCDSEEDGDDLGDLDGLWRLQSVDGSTAEVGETYFRFQGNTVTFYSHFVFGEEDCYITESSSVESEGGNTYTITESDTEESTGTITVNGDQMTIVASSDGETDTLVLTRSNANVSQFTPQCNFE